MTEQTKNGETPLESKFIEPITEKESRKIGSYDLEFEIWNKSRDKFEYVYDIIHAYFSWTYFVLTTKDNKKMKFYTDKYELIFIHQKNGK